MLHLHRSLKQLQILSPFLIQFQVNRMLAGIEEMAEIDSGDHFTLTDRKELIRQGILIDQFKEDVLDLKILVNDNYKNNTLEIRVRALEDYKLSTQASIKASLWWVTTC